MTGTAATDLLRADHRAIEGHIDRLLELARNLRPAGVEALRALAASLAVLAALHFRREEGILYPWLRGGLPQLLGRMDEQHEYTREMEGHLSEALAGVNGAVDERQLANLRNFATELHDSIQHHIVEEEDDLFRLADERLSVSEQDGLAALMKEIGAN
ncbi:MAG: hemerythrin domain-containing protein [Bryobacterales bacterium]|nr:hemerythrin domain-containing protein [Bryobacterales bacterium]